MSDEPQIPALVGQGRRSQRGPQSEPPRVSRRNGGGTQIVGEMPAEFIDPETGEPYRRRSLSEQLGPWNELREDSKQAGWAYQWSPARVLNEPVDASQARMMHEGGWRPVKPSEMPNEIPPGWKADTIERHGQILYKRPAYLNAEAKKESHRLANQQVVDRYTTAGMNTPGRLPKVSEISQTIEPLPDDMRTQRAVEVGEVEYEEA